MMWWSNGSWGHGWWPAVLVMGVFMVICMVLMARMMGHAMPGSHTRESERHGPDVPERIGTQRTDRVDRCTICRRVARRGRRRDR